MSCVYSDLILPNRIRTQIQHWLAEDVPSFDYGGFVVGSKFFIFFSRHDPLNALADDARRRQDSASTRQE
ncbi:hypothetical protein OAV88_03595 [bacterium]|nr:hypothetical protein [bacterium]